MVDSPLMEDAPDWRTFAIRKRGVLSASQISKEIAWRFEVIKSRNAIIGIWERDRNGSARRQPLSQNGQTKTSPARPPSVRDDEEGNQASDCVAQKADGPSRRSVREPKGSVLHTRSEEVVTVLGEEKGTAVLDSPSRPDGIRILEVRDGLCRWPLTKETGFEAYRACGCPCNPARPYCEEHRRRSRAKRTGQPFVQMRKARRGVAA